MTNPTATLSTITNLWLEASVGVFSQDSLDKYRGLLENHVIPYFGERTDISKEELMAFRAEKLDAGLSESLMFTLCRLLERILSYGAGHGLCPDPGWNLTLPKPRRKRHTVILSPEEDQRLCSFLTQEAAIMHLGFFLMLTTGISIGEVLGIRWKDVSVKNSNFRVHVSRGPMLGRKNKTRLVDFGERQRIYLRKMQGEPEEYLCSGKMKPRSRASMESKWRKIVDYLLLPPMSPMDLRHTYAVRCIEGGMDYETLSGRLGIENLQNFRVTYRALVSEDQKERLEKERFESRKVRQAPASRTGGPLDAEATPYRLKLEKRRQELKEEVEALDGELAILRHLRYSDCIQGMHRKAFYDFIARVLPDDKDAAFAVDYLRANMRVEEMSYRKVTTPQAIRRRVTHGFEKLSARIDELEAIEGWEMLPLFNQLCDRIEAVAPPAPKRTGPKGRPTVENRLKAATAALERIEAALEKVSD